jgi:hypothetical protein|tara:strand:- start:952 stop:1359 length:408 start_codon:yes stop_codon:yes gene_type:complete
LNKINTFLLILLLSISSKQISAHQITNAEVGFNPFAPQIYITYYNEKADTAKCMAYKENGGLIGVTEVFVINTLAKMSVSIPYDQLIESRPTKISCVPTSYLSFYNSEKVTKNPYSVLCKKYYNDELITCKKIAN